jgi:transcriptional regulator with XRE-family HTH domain
MHLQLHFVCEMEGAPMGTEAPLSPQTRTALQILGTQLATARRTRRWRLADLAERAGVSIPTVRNIEHGSPTVAIGTVFEVAHLLGVPLYGADSGAELRSIHGRFVDRMAVLPARVRTTASDAEDLDDAF